MPDELTEELRAIADRLTEAAAVGEREDTREPLQKVNLKPGWRVVTLAPSQPIRSGHLSAVRPV